MKKQWNPTRRRFTIDKIVEVIFNGKAITLNKTININNKFYALNEDEQEEDNNVDDGATVSNKQSTNTVTGEKNTCSKEEATSSSKQQKKNMQVRGTSSFHYRVSLQQN